MTRPNFSMAAMVIFLGFSGQAAANFHLWTTAEVFSNADGTVQFIELFCVQPGQNVLVGHDLTATSDSNAIVYSIPTNPVGSTANKSLLFATPGFANLPGAVTPDYTIPTGFFDPDAAIISIDFAGVDVFVFAGTSLPTDGMLSMLRDNSTPLNSPTNFDGETGQVIIPLFASGFEDLP